MRRFILTVLLLAASLPQLHGVTNIKEDKKGVILFRMKSNEDRLDKPLLFQHLQRDEVYWDATTQGDLLVHVQADLVVKIVYFINPSTFPTKFGPDDLALIKAKIDELHALAALSQDAGKLASPQLQYLQNIYDTESTHYQQTVAIASQKFDSDSEKADFDKKCELLKLDLQASKDDIKKSEEIIKKMEPLASRSEMLTGVLSKWNQEKNRAQQLSTECQKFWAEAQKAHGENFRNAAQLGDIPDFPAETKGGIADLEGQLEQFHNTVTYPQVLYYCRNEIPAFFLLNETPKLVERIKSLQYREAAAFSQKTLHQVHPQQIVAPYTGIYATFKNYSDLVDDIRSRFYQQLTKAKMAEGDLTNRELLIEYQKAYDIIPDSKVAAKIEELKTKIQSQ